MKVKVYRNLHKDCYSVMAAEGPNYGRVIAHRDRVVLRNATFTVSQAGRQRVLDTGRKNVHAFVRGEWDEADRFCRPLAGGVEVRYSPRKVETWIAPDLGMLWVGREVEAAAIVDLYHTGPSEPQVFAYDVRYASARAQEGEA